MTNYKENKLIFSFESNITIIDKSDKNNVITVNVFDSYKEHNKYRIIFRNNEYQIKDIILSKDKITMTLVTKGSELKVIIRDFPMVTEMRNVLYKKKHNFLNELINNKKHNIQKLKFKYINNSNNIIFTNMNENDKKEDIYVDTNYYHSSCSSISFESSDLDDTVYKYIDEEIKRGNVKTNAPKMDYGAIGAMIFASVFLGGLYLISLHSKDRKK